MAITRGPGSAAYLCADACGAAPAPALRRKRHHRDTALRRTGWSSAQPTSASIPPDTCSGPRRSGSRVPDGVWVVGGDYKRAADPTCAPFEPVRVRHLHHGVHLRPADLSLGRDRRSSSQTSSSGGRPTRDAASASMLFCYTLGKAQRLLAELARVTDRTILVHGMMAGMIGRLPRGRRPHAARACS